MPVSDYDPIINAASQEWDVDPNWVRSVMQDESAGSPVDAQGRPIRSPTDAGGLMQIEPATATQLGVGNVDDPVQNIWGGVKYLAQLRDRYNGNVQLATAAYNAGPERVDAYVNAGQPLPAETQAYVPKVATYYQNFARQYQPPQALPITTPTMSPAPVQPGVPSDSDFLKMTGGAPPTSQAGIPAVPSDDDFLKMVSGGKGAAPPAAPSATDLAPGEAAFELQPDAGARAVAAGNSIGSAIVQGATQGWQNTPDILSPEASAWLSAHGLGAIGNNTGLPSYALKTLSAGAGALQAGIAQLGTVAGVPLLGRDIAALPEAFAPELAANPLVARPMARANPLAADVAQGDIVRNPLASSSPILGGGAPLLASDLPAYVRRGVDPFAAQSAPAPLSNPLASRAPVSVIPTPAFIPPGSAVPLAPRAAALLAEDQRIAGTAPPGVPPVGAVIRDPVTGAGAPVVQPANPLSTVATVPHAAPLQASTAANVASVGAAPLQAPAIAAAPAAAPAMPAALPSPAEALAARSTAEAQRVLAPAKTGVDTTIYVPGTQPTEAEVSGNPTIAAEQKFNRSRNPDPHIAQETANNAARVEYFNQVAGTPTQVHQLEEARGAQANQDLQAAFGSKQPTDAQPVVNTINGILNDPRLGQRDLVQKYVAPYLDKLTNEDGSLVSDPEALYGIRENITDQLSKAGRAETPGVAQAARQLMQVKGALDDAIEAGAPGYRQYLDNYSAASRPIDAMQYLQDMRPSLTNAQGTMTPAAFDRFMKNTVSDRAAGGISPAASLSDDQMAVLNNIHSDLKRFQNINLSNPRGSDTNMLGHLASKGGELAVHGVANYVAPILGSVAVKMAKNALEARSIERTTNRVLNPSPLKYPPTSP